MNLKTITLGTFLAASTLMTSCARFLTPERAAQGRQKCGRGLGVVEPAHSAASNAFASNMSQDTKTVQVNAPALEMGK